MVNNKDLKGAENVLLNVFSQYAPGGTEESRRNLSARPRFEPATSRIQGQRVIASGSLLV
jgi:hypothetical protein